MLKQFEKARSGLLNAHRELWKTKYELITDMASIIDQAKFLGDMNNIGLMLRVCKLREL